MLRLLMSTALALVTSAQAGTFTVTNTNDSGPGSLRDAVAQAGVDTINFNVTGTIVLTTGDIRIRGPLTIVGPGANSLTIDGNLNNRIFTIYTTDPACPTLDGPDYRVSISGLTLQNARRNSDNTGGAVWTSHSLALEQVVIQNNAARSGAAVSFLIQYPGQTLTIASSSFLNNTAREVVASTSSQVSGGAVYIAEKCSGTQTTPVTVTIGNTLFQGNRVQPTALIGHGGAIATESYADITITDSRIIDNHVEPPNPPLNKSYNGGGIWAGAKSLTIERSEVAANTARSAGGVRVYNDILARQTPQLVMAVRIVNSTVSGNRATADAGGALNVLGNVSVEIDNSTVSDNSASVIFSGGAFFTTGATAPASSSDAIAPTLELASSILADNLSSALGGTSGDISVDPNKIASFRVDAGTLIENFAPSIVIAGANNKLRMDPVLGSLAFNGGPTRTQALLSGSPAFGAGANPLNLTTDQRGAGYPRTFNGATDIGAYQFVNVGPATPDLNQHGLTGSYYEPATSGQGVELEVYPDLTAPGTGLAFLSWFTYDSVVGGADRQRWYTADGPVVTGQPSATLTINRNTGGNFNAPPITESNGVGTATLSFDSCTTGTLSYTFTDGSGRTGSIPLRRLTQSMTCSTTGARPTNADFAFSGNWYDPATSGQGVTLEVNTGSQVLFLAWYTYAPNGVGAGPAGQRWYTAEQTTPLLPGARTIPLRFFETTGGAFDPPTSPEPNTVVVGSGILAFQSCSSATLSYNFTSGSSSGASGSIALKRVGPVPAGCVM